MRRGRGCLVVALVMVLGGVPAATATADMHEGVGDMVKGDRSITYVGAIINRADHRNLRLGSAGYWLPHFDQEPSEDRAPTEEAAIDALPPWVAPFNHATISDPGCHQPNDIERGCLPGYQFRTFSGDGPAYSAGGFSMVHLPGGECGRSGAIVDPFTFITEEDQSTLPDPTEPGTGENTNNTINRVQLQDGRDERLPTTFYVSVLTDNTGNEFDAKVVEVRGNVSHVDAPGGISQVDIPEDTGPTVVNNGVPDLYVFKITNFAVGDYLKLRLRGATSDASFGGLFFDREPPAQRRGSPVDCSN